MSEQPPTLPKKESTVTNPQIIAAGITAFATIMVALITVLPNILPKDTPTATPVVIVVTPTVATEIPASTTAAPPTQPPTEVVNTDVPPPTATIAPATAVPSSTPVPVAAVTSSQTPNLLLMYDDVSFTVLNQSASVVSLEGVVFRSSAGEWDAVGWGTSLYNSLPVGMCLRMRDASVGQRQPPQPCVNQIYGLIETQGRTLFWLGVEQFDVVKAGTIIANCAVASGSCPIYVSG